MISRRSVWAAMAPVLFAICLVAGSKSSFAQRPAARSTTPIPSPKSVLGFTPGEDRTIADWSQITNYFGRLDQASDRVALQPLGQSTLKRPLFVAIISARENILALQKYKEV